MSQSETNVSEVNEEASSFLEMVPRAEIIQQQQEDTMPDVLCSYCQNGSDAEQIIRPCQCMIFTHIHCLECMIKAGISSCRNCQVSFSIERRNKPLLEWCRNTEALQKMFREICCSIFKMLLLMLYNVILIIIISLIIMHLDFSTPAQFIPLISTIAIFLSLLLFPISQEVFMLDFCIKRYVRKAVYAILAFAGKLAIRRRE